MIKYYPYGVCRISQGDLATDKLFTGQRLDNIGLYYYGARYYDPTIGRFISPDTMVPNYMNPQAFNRFSYVANNPLRYIDPTGYYWDYDDDNGWRWYPDEDEEGETEPDEPRDTEPSLPLNPSNPIVPQDPKPSLFEFELEVIFDAFGQVWSFPNTDLGLIAWALSGGLSRPRPRSTTIVEGIDPDSITGKLMVNLLDTQTFTLGYVILTTEPEIKDTVLDHELGHVTQSAILGFVDLPAYGLDWLAAGGWWGESSGCTSS